jgi:hypothetical protein
MATGNDLIDATLDWLLGGQDETINVLASDPDEDDTNLSFSYELEGIVPGSMICVGTEVMRVVDTNNTAHTATVVRAQRGSTAAAHATGDVVQVSPRFSRWSVFRAINDDLDDLSGLGLYQMKTVDITYNAAVTGYNLTNVTDIEQIYSVRYEVPGPSKEWPLLKPSHYRFERNAPTSDFASGFSLILYRGAYPGRSIRVAYKAPFTRLSAATDDVQSVAGLPSTANDLPPLGAALRLIAGHEAGRVRYESQPDTRRPDEVPVGAQLQTAGAWQRLRNQRLDGELRRLSRRYPMRRG